MKQPIKEQARQKGKLTAAHRCTTAFTVTMETSMSCYVGYGVELVSQ